MQEKTINTTKVTLGNNNSTKQDNFKQATSNTIFAGNITMKCGRMNLKIPKKGKNFTGIPKYRTNHLLGHKTIYLQKPKQHANIRQIAFGTPITLKTFNMSTKNITCK